MNIGLHHLLHKYGYLDINEDPLIQNKKFRTFINRGIYGIGAFGVIVIVPQIVKIWVDRDFGASIATWIGFFIGALFWLFYGLVHKEKPIIVTNLAVLLADIMVISGLIFLK